MLKKETLKIRILKKSDKSLFDYLMYYIIEVFKKDSDKFDRYTVYFNLEVQLFGISTSKNLYIKITYIKDYVLSEKNMKKIAITLGLGALMVSCTNAKLVNYNTDRLDNIEAYLKENKFVRPSDNLDKLRDEGQIEFTTQYKSLEREADAWKENQEQQQ